MSVITCFGKSREATEDRGGQSGKDAWCAVSGGESKVSNSKNVLNRTWILSPCIRYIGCSQKEE